MKRLAILIVSLVLMGGCFWGGSPRRSTLNPRPAISSFSGVLLVLSGRREGATGYIEFDGVRQQGAVGSNCWHEPEAMQCADYAPEVMVPRSYLDVPQGTVLRLQTDATRVDALIGALTRDRGRTQIVNPDSLGVRADGDLAIIDLPVGFYTLNAHGIWPLGEAPLYFGIRVT